MPVMSSRYAGKCKKCQTRYSQGASIFWSRATGGLCLACHGGADPAPGAPTPRRTAARDRTETKGARTTREFGSWGEFVAYAETHAKADKESYARSYMNGDMWWHGTEFPEEAFKLARHGWSDIRPEVDALVEKIDAKVAPMTKPAFESYFDVSGGTVDIGRFLDGEPECMVETRLIEIAKPGRVVSLLIDGFYSSSIKPKSIIARGVAIVALIEALEKMQHGTEVWYETSFRGNPLTYLVKLKSAEDVLDVDMLMFAIAHPSAYRRINFAAQERVGENRKFRVGEGNCYGGPDGLKMGERVGAAIELERLVHGTEIADGAVWVEKVLSDFGLIREDVE